MKRYVYIHRDDLSDRGYNVGIEVYQLVRGGFPRFVGADYKINSASWKGAKATATMVACEKDGHKHDGYNFISKNIAIQEL